MWPHPPKAIAGGHQREYLNLHTEPQNKMEYAYQEIHPGIKWYPENQSLLQEQLLPVGSQVAATTCSHNKGRCGKDTPVRSWFTLNLIHSELEVPLCYTIPSKRRGNQVTQSLRMTTQPKPRGRRLEPGGSWAARLRWKHTWLC